MAGTVYPFNGTQDFILRHAGATPGGNVFNSVAEVTKVMASIPGWKRLVIDSTVDLVEFPAGTFPMHHVQLTGLAPPGQSPNGRLSVLNLADGCKLPGLRYILGDLLVETLGASDPIVDASDFNIDGDWIVIGGEIGISGVPFLLSGGAPIWEVGSNFVRVEMGGKIFPGTAPIFSMSDDGFMIVGCFRKAFLEDDWVSGVGGATPSVITVFGQGGSIYGVPPSFLGVMELIPQRPGVPYIFGNASISGTADSRWMNPGVTTNVAATTPQLNYPMFTRSGFVKNISAWHQTAAGDGDAVVYEIFIDGVATGVSISVPSGAIGGDFNDVDFAFVDAFQVASVKATKAVSITAGTFEPIATFDYFPNEG